MSSDEAEVPNPSNPPNRNQSSMTNSAYNIISGDTSNAPIVSPPLNGKNYYFRDVEYSWP